ncbi:hypothetical protein AgCh_020566 [Apium graveolens]
MILAPDITEAALCRIPTPIISHMVAINIDVGQGGASSSSSSSGSSRDPVGVPSGGVVGLDSISFDVDLLDKFLSSQRRKVNQVSNSYPTDDQQSYPTDDQQGNPTDDQQSYPADDQQGYPADDQQGNSH